MSCGSAEVALHTIVWCGSFVNARPRSHVGLLYPGAAEVTSCMSRFVVHLHFVLFIYVYLSPPVLQVRYAMNVRLVVHVRKLRSLRLFVPVRNVTSLRLLILLRTATSISLFVHVHLVARFFVRKMEEVWTV